MEGNEMVIVQYRCMKDDGIIEFLSVVANDETEAFSKVIQYGLDNGKVKYTAIDTEKIRPYSDNPVELVELFKTVPENKRPFYVLAIEWGLDVGIKIPKMFNSVVGYAYGDSHFTKEFNEFYQNWCDENFMPETKNDCN